MHYHLDTIPVWDALKLGGECPLCALRRKNELLMTQRYLGGSLMEPAMRVRVNERGFCQKHQQLLFAQQNKLGVGLLTHSGAKETEKKLEKIYAGAQDGGKLRRGQAKDAVRKAAGQLRALSDACILCDELSELMKRYAYTYVMLWQSDSSFKKAMEASMGACVPDTALLYEAAAEALKDSELGAFVRTLNDINRASLTRVTNELEWFTLKFDYRNADKPWGNSKDAPEREITRLRGWCVGAEPNPKEP